MADQSLPTYTDSVAQQFHIEPLSGPRDTSYYIDRRFSPALYRGTSDTRLYKLLQALMGKAGVGWLRTNLLEARILLDHMGIESFDLDDFYGDPLKFGRFLDEIVTDDQSGLIPPGVADDIRLKDAAYRSRALDFVKGARAGGTPSGMRFVARSALGFDTRIIENYKFLYDIHSDDPIGYTYAGKTVDTSEFIVVPQPEVSSSVAQTVTLVAKADTLAHQTIDAGTWNLVYNGDVTLPGSWGWTANLSVTATAYDVQVALEALNMIGHNNVKVSGGPAPYNSFQISFTGALALQPVPDITVYTALLTSAGGAQISAIVTKNIGSLDTSQELSEIPARSVRDLRVALDQIRPWTTLPTLGQGSGVVHNINWETANAFSTGELSHVLRYVTGTPAISWPPPTSVYWIEGSIEHASPLAPNYINHHYAGYHQFSGLRAYTDDVLTRNNYLADVESTRNYSSEHAGQFRSQMLSAYPVLRTNNSDAGAAAQANLLIRKASHAISPSPERLEVSASLDTSDNSISLIKGIYPIDYAKMAPSGPLQGSTVFWASLERDSGGEYLEIDFGNVVAVNYVTFSLMRAPLTISIDYDVLDQYPARRFIPVTPIEPWRNTTVYSSDQNPWEPFEYNFTNAKGQLVFTRHLRIGFTRDPNQKFLFDTSLNVQQPWSIQVSGLIVGRIVDP